MNILKDTSELLLMFMHLKDGYTMNNKSNESKQDLDHKSTNFIFFYFCYIRSWMIPKRRSPSFKLYQ